MAALFSKDSRSINLRMVAKVIGWLLMIESAFMAIPAITALSLAEPDFPAFAIAAAVTFAAGFATVRLVRPRRSSMSKREGFLLTASVWVVFSLFGMLPFIFGNRPLSPVDAFFEAMSGFTTTGCSAYPDPAALSKSASLWRAMMQWIGGLGIILFTLAVIPMLNSSGGMQMFNAEVTGITHEKIHPRISQTAKSLWLIYISLTLACCLLLWAGSMDFFDSLCHALGTISTGGFASHPSLGSAPPDAVSEWDSSYTDVVVTCFMFLGGTSFSLLYFAVSGQWARIRGNVTFRTYAFIILASLVIFAVASLLSPSVPTLRSVIIEPAFQIVSVATSTGYMLPSLPTWAPVCIALLLPLMIFGACAGSTSGGAKIDRLMVLMRFARNSVKRALQPNNITAVEIDGHVLPSDTVQKVIAFLCLYAIIIVSSGIILAMMGIPAFDSFYLSASCITNLGAGPDAVGGATAIPALPSAAKLILSLVMLTGRLELYTILMLFISPFWSR